MTIDDEPLAVATHHLTKSFGDRVVVDALDLAIPVGSVCGFVGPNGAGKTTTIRMLLGLVRPTGGHGFVLGHPLSEPARYLPRVGALIEAPAFYPTLSGADNLLVLTKLAGVERAVIEPTLRRVGLDARAGDPYRSYSLGMKQRLGIAAALLVTPSLVLLDEPTNGLDPAGILEMRGLVRSLADDGTTVIVSSHLLGEIEQICDHLVMIRDGRLLFQGSVADLDSSQSPSVLVRAERCNETAALYEAVIGSGFTACLEDDLETIVVEGDLRVAAQVNRLAMSSGITLVQLTERRRSLEEVFLDMTDSVTDGHGVEELGAVR